MRPLALLITALALHSAAAAAPSSVLFVGNSYTFGRVDPVMSYNTARRHARQHAGFLPQRADALRHAHRAEPGCPGCR